MSESTPPSETVLGELALRRRRQGEVRAQQRRRRAWWLSGGAVLVLLLVVVVTAWQLGGDSSNPNALNRVEGGAPARDIDVITTDPPSASSTEASTTEPSSTTEQSTTTTGSPTRVPIALPLANQTKPPEPPVGLYRQGKLFLVGSVPDEETGAGFLRKAVGVLGEAAVTMDMTRDPRVPQRTMRIIVQEEFQFPTGSSAFDKSWEGLLNLGVIALQRIPEATLVVTGYTDNTGSADVNQSLSEQRAQVVADYMIGNGIPADRVVALGRGPADPIADNSTPEGRDRNRRIEGSLEGITP